MHPTATKTIRYTRTLKIALAASTILYGCSSDIECGPGTQLTTEDVCEAETFSAICGPGRVFRISACVPTASISALDQRAMLPEFGEIAYRAPLRNSAGPNYVLLHGIYGGTSHRSLLELADELDARGGRVFLLDLVGVGESDKQVFTDGSPTGVRRRYTSELISDFVIAFVNEVVHDPVVLVAESSATMSVLEASRSLSQVQSAVLLSPTGVNVQSTPPTPEQNASFDRLASDESALSDFYVNQLLSEQNIRAIVTPGFSDASLVTEDLLDEYRRGRQILDQKWISLSFTSAQIYSSFSRVQTGVSSRVLMIFGAEDEGVITGAGPGEGSVIVSEPDRADDFAEIAPRFEYLTLPNLGQIFWKENPSLVAEIILSFSFNEQ